MFDFKIKKKCTSSLARLGVYQTLHGEIETPCFMPVGTKGTVKTLIAEDLKSLGAEIILGNTYHLELRPGSELIKRMGGLHKWSSWDKPILTDSGGFQVFSLSLGKDKNNPLKKSLVKISDEGVMFSSYLDGSKHFFSPEKVMEIEHNLGADIMMAFDECVPADTNEDYTYTAMNRTHRWLERCIKVHQESKKDKEQALFGIVQGGVHKDLRIESAKFVSAQEVAGIAIGGLSVGEGRETMCRVIDQIVPYLPEDKIRYLMGVGDPMDLIECIDRGIDIFDCVLPTRLARHGTALVKQGKLHLLNENLKEDNSPVQAGCKCVCCQNYSRSYISHLIRENEISGLHLLSMHNIAFLFNLITEVKEAIQSDKMPEFKQKWKNNLTK